MIDMEIPLLPERCTGKKDHIPTQEPEDREEKIFKKDIKFLQYIVHISLKSDGQILFFCTFLEIRELGFIIKCLCILSPSPAKLARVKTFYSYYLL